MYVTELGEAQFSDFPSLISVAELADLLQLSVRTIWRLNSAGKLPKPLRLGRSVKWRKNEILQWLAQDCPPQSPKASGK